MKSTTFPFPQEHGILHSFRSIENVFSHLRNGTLRDQLFIFARLYCLFYSLINAMLQKRAFSVADSLKFRFEDHLDGSLHIGKQIKTCSATVIKRSSFPEPHPHPSSAA